MIYIKRFSYIVRYELQIIEKATVIEEKEGGKGECMKNREQDAEITT